MVTVDSGIKETATLAEVPQSRWRELVDVRRLSLGISLAKDCRRLVEYVDDAEQMYPVLGFSSAAELIRNGLDLKPDEVELAVRWLRLRMPDYPIPYSVAIQRGEEYQKRDARDRQKQRPVGRPPNEILYNNKNDVQHYPPPTGNSTEAVLRRLRKDRLDLHTRVMKELSAHAAMIEAGFRTSRPRDPLSGLSRLRRAWKRATAEERATFRAEIRDGEVE
jgi:hypothetical protein